MILNSIKVLLISLIVPTILFGDDYSFDIDELDTIDVKNYEYSGYLKGEYKYLNLNNQPNSNSYIGEAMVDFKYFKEKFTFNSEFMINYQNIDHIEDNSRTVNQLYLNYKHNENHRINIGKISSKWGKGYFFNPIAFIDRKKDPNNPELTKEGYELLGYKYNKVFKNFNLKNFAFDLIYFPTSQNQNDDFYDKASNNIALKSYFLYFDTDIDIAYLYSGKLANKLGIDFSTNLETNFELHGEAVRDSDGLYSYLIGIKYLTISDLTITSEYFYQNEILNQTEPFWDNRYFLNKFSQKEPFDILYSSVYFKNSLNIDDHSYQNILGVTYSFKNNIDLDISIGDNYGKELSEYGSKRVDKFFSFESKWSF
ncbi:MAG: hypothetical protein U9R16_07330 [Campylobacterota bacterium]|nr:hypothetical protein [Campylobacterota bacterium]